MRRDFVFSLLMLVAVGVFTTAGFGQTNYRDLTPAEARTEKAFNQAVADGPLAVRAWLADFPKGADLHIHLSGSVYAEDMIRAAGEDGICVDPVGLKFVKPPAESKDCGAPLVPAKDLSGKMTAANQVLYDKLIDSFSMRSYVPTTAWSGHDQFFATFEKFGGLDKRHVGEWVDELTKISAMQNQQYDELMQTPSFGHAAKLGYEVGWPTDSGTPNFAEIRQKLIDKGLRDEVAVDRAELKEITARRNEIGKCGTAEAKPECTVEVRYIFQVLRGFPPEQVFAQTLLGFEVVEQAIEEKSDDWVGINFVMPEDGYISMRDYSLQMRMIEYLHGVYPKVHISLHAGELAPGLVTPEGLRFHIREAVEIAHAERIGHGVDVMYEKDANVLLKEMAEKHVMVEINLSSNDGILNVKGQMHPLKTYLKAHVPVALSTDDEGVSRIDITNEYVRAATEQGLTYTELKQSARTGMEHNFLPGASLWAQPDGFGYANKACAHEALGGAKPAADCKKFLDANEKAAAQWELERRFREFEAKF